MRTFGCTCVFMHAGGCIIVMPYIKCTLHCTFDSVCAQPTQKSSGWSKCTISIGIRAAMLRGRPALTGGRETRKESVEVRRKQTGAGM